MRPMRDDEFERWLPRMRDEYAQDMVQHGGASVDAAREQAAVDIEGLFPDGHPTPDQAVFVLEADGEAIGELWFAEREEPLERGALWIYQARIDDRYRGRGYGRAAMLLAEDEARRRGLSRVTFNVFGGNEVARNLFRSLGYVETALILEKPV
jgi:ribosomal protein S18 acetylase RimI-like enzyme